jgi:DNA-binding beta-propeller fold protein YncE
VKQTLNNNNINIYPNPAKDRITVSFDNNKQDATISIIDMTGRKVLSQKIAAGKNSINIDVYQLPAGIYGLLIQTPDGTISKQWMKAN